MKNFTQMQGRGREGEQHQERDKRARRWICELAGSASSSAVHPQVFSLVQDESWTTISYPEDQ